MAKKRPTFSEQLRAAVKSAPMTRYRISLDTGIEQSILSRFVNGTGLDSATIDKLCDYLELELRPKNSSKGR